MAYQISIVEDEVEFSSQLTEHIRRFSQETGKETEVKVYHNPYTFLETRSADIDVLFLDIKMPGMTGMELAEELRKFDKKLIIVFTTSFRQYAIDGYSVYGFGYLLKPISYESLKQTLFRAIESLEATVGKYIVVKSDGQYQKIAVNDIMFIEVMVKDLIIHLKNGELKKAKGPLSALSRKLDGLGFVRCERSYIINLQYVSVVEGNDILIGENRIPITRGTKKKFMATLAEYSNKN